MFYLHCQLMSGAVIKVEKTIFAEYFFFFFKSKKNETQFVSYLTLAYCYDMIKLFN